MKAVIARIVAIGALLGSTQCRAKDEERAADRARVAATSEADATSAVISEPLAFRLEPPGPGWKAFHGQDAARWADGAVAGAMSPRDVLGAVYVTKKSDADLGKHVEAMVERMRLVEPELVMGTLEEGSGTQTQHFEVTGTTAGLRLHYRGQAQARGGLVYELMAWAPAKADPVAADADAEAFMRAFSLASAPAEPKSLPAATPSPSAPVGADFAWRRGRFRDYLLSLTLAPPSGWSLEVGAAARVIHPEARAHFHHAGLQLHGLLTARERIGDESAEHDHGRLIASAQKAVGLEPGPSRAGKLGDADARVSEGRATIGGASMQYRIVSAPHDGRIVVLWLWGAPEKMRRGAEALNSLAASVDLEVALPATEATTEAYRDHRMGYAITTPSGWLRDEATPDTLAGSGSLIRWEMDGRWIAVLAAALPGAPSRHPWMVSFLEQLLRDELGSVTRATAERTETELAGQPATRIAWQAPLQRANAFLFHRDGVAYAVVTVDHGDEATSLVQKSLVLLP